MNSERSFRPWWRRILPRLAGLIFLVVAGILAWCAYAFRDRNPHYHVSLERDGARAKAEPRPLRAGFARVKISPVLGDPALPVWMAGFSHHRAATRIHDDLWAVAGVIDDGHTRIAIVALDAIGFFHDDVINVRQRLDPAWKVDYAIVCSTHNHSTPDLMGLWGPTLLRTGVDPSYLEQVQEAAKQAIGNAVASLEPARVAFHEITTPASGLVADTRKPIVFDSDLRLMHFTSPATGKTIGSLVGWGNHPETPWAGNTELTADFPGYLRDALERGIIHDGKTNLTGLGGMHLFVNGAVGGLMTTHPSTVVRDPFQVLEYTKPTHEKARAVGETLAKRVLNRLAATNAPGATHAPISIRAKTFDLPIDNGGFLLAPVLGVLNRGHSRWKHFRTEAALLTFGDASMVCIPGEIYPEIVNGGIEKAPGGDFAIDPLEVPPIRQMMPGKIKFVFGLANDEIGYIIPKSEWDRKRPYIYGAAKPVYGEVNSVGPGTAASLHAVIKEFCEAARGRAGPEEK